MSARTESSAGVSIEMRSTILAFLLLFQQQRTPPTVHLPTSDAIDVARQLARDLGFPIDRYRKLYFFDVLTAEGGKPWFAGYTSIGFYGNGQPINHFEINERTGQVVDSTTCQVFDFPDLRVFQIGQQQLSGSRPRTTKELMEEIGCDELTVVRRPVVPITRSESPKK
jgi:hypothetical protein